MRPMLDAADDHIRLTKKFAWACPGEWLSGTYISR
jgi:hypothetical protein